MAVFLRVLTDLSRVDNFFTSYEGNNCFIIPNETTQRCIKLECFVLQKTKKIISGFRKCKCGIRLKKKSIFKALPVIRTCRPGEHFLLSGVVDRTSTSCYQELQTGRALPVIRSCRPGDNLLSSSTLYMFRLSTRLLPVSYNFLQNFKIVLLLFYIVKRYITFIYWFFSSL